MRPISFSDFVVNSLFNDTFRKLDLLTNLAELRVLFTRFVSNSISRAANGIVKNDIRVS